MNTEMNTADSMQDRVAPVATTNNETADYIAKVEDANTKENEMKTNEQKMIITENNGPLLKASNYWDSQMARRGQCFVSINKGTFRLLLPDSLKSIEADIRTGKYVAITLGMHRHTGWMMYEIMFDDGSDSPYSLWINPEQFERSFSISDAASKDRELIVYSRGCVVVARFPAYFRESDLLPYLKEVRKAVGK